MELHVAFYRGSGGWKNKIIRWWTKSPYSHVELVLPDNETWISISPLLTSKVAMRTRKEWDPKQWELVKLDITEQQLLVILEFYESTKGCSYDWVGMFLSQFLPFHIKRKGEPKLPFNDSI